MNQNRLTFFLCIALTLLFIRLTAQSTQAPFFAPDQQAEQVFLEALKSRYNKDVAALQGAILPARSDSVLVVEYFKKAKRLDMRMEKIN